MQVDLRQSGVRDLLSFEDLDELHAVFVEPLVEQAAAVTGHRKFRDGVKSQVGGGSRAILTLSYWLCAAALVRSLAVCFCLGSFAGLDVCGRLVYECLCRMPLLRLLIDCDMRCPALLHHRLCNRADIFFHGCAIALPFFTGCAVLCVCRSMTW